MSTNVQYLVLADSVSWPVSHQSKVWVPWTQRQSWPQPAVRDTIRSSTFCKKRSSNHQTYSVVNSLQQERKPVIADLLTAPRNGSLTGNIWQPIYSAWLTLAMSGTHFTKSAWLAMTGTHFRVGWGQKGLLDLELDPFIHSDELFFMLYTYGSSKEQDWVWTDQCGVSQVDMRRCLHLVLVEAAPLYMPDICWLMWDGPLSSLAQSVPGMPLSQGRQLYPLVACTLFCQCWDTGLQSVQLSRWPPPHQIAVWNSQIWRLLTDWCWALLVALLWDIFQLDLEELRQECQQSQSTSLTSPTPWRPAATHGN